MPAHDGQPGSGHSGDAAGSATTQPMLSVAIVCKNNVGMLPRTLDSVAGIAGEVVAVDSGSTDGTLELLRARGVRVIESPWLGHVRTKQLALESSRGEWVLSLDSDESLEPDAIEAVRRAVSETGPDIGGFELRRVVWYRGRPLRHSWQPEWRLRLVRRGSAAWGGIDPHDKLGLIRGTAARLQGTIRHDSFATFGEHLGKQLAYSRMTAEQLHRQGTRGSRARLVISPVGAFLKQLVLKQSWRDGYAGWLAAGTTAAGALMKHMILLELNRSPLER